jgi:hypothetical protein
MLLLKYVIVSILSILSTIIFVPIIVLLIPFCFILAVLVTLFLSFSLSYDTITK